MDTWSSRKTRPLSEARECKHRQLHQERRGGGRAAGMETHLKSPIQVFSCKEATKGEDREVGTEGCQKKKYKRLWERRGRGREREREGRSEGEREREKLAHIHSVWNQRNNPQKSSSYADVGMGLG